MVLRLDAAAAHASGREFYISANGVYLTDAVPLEFVSELDGTTAPLPDVDLATDMDLRSPALVPQSPK